MTEAIKALLGTDCPEDKLGRNYAEVIALAVVKRASKGDIRAAAEIADRTEGKPVQAHFIAASINESTARRLADLAERLMPELAPAPAVGGLLIADSEGNCRGDVK